MNKSPDPSESINALNTVKALELLKKRPEHYIETKTTQEAELKALDYVLDKILPSESGIGRDIEE